MTREEAITWLIQPTVTSTKVSASKAKEQEAYDMAIEALQVEPTKAVCDDCIWHVCNYNKVDWDAPSAEAEWIPCSERLPDVGEDVLLQFRVAQCVGNRCLDYDDNGWVINSGGEWQTPILDGDEEPIAWMPLPEPYREDGEA